ncbi:cytoplasmic FMR1-interacting protein-like isoform X2 [Lineus longissimus]|uniref:cytoplasmic FMR1-interacting protein-like isoform X2 n=1 Tax=Lineus longissimus TaxID=88925 RepID=UPI002B4F0524
MAESEVAMKAPTEKITLLDVMQNVEALDSLLLPDQQPCIEAASVPISYQANMDTNFEDRTAFVTGVARYIEEATVHAELNTKLEDGQSYAAMLYTWRCSSRALPQVKSNEQTNRVEINEKIVEVLQPHIQKLTNLMYFQKKAIETFCGEVKRLSHEKKKNDFVSEAYLLTLGKFLNMFAVLDELKNMKASINNDNAAYRRAAMFLGLINDPERMQESQALGMFLATHNQIRNTLKEGLEKIPNYEDLLIEIINLCVNMFDTKLYVLPEEKHMLVKVIGICLFLMDSGTKEVNIYKFDSKRRINLSKIDKIFKQLEVVPLYGDMQIAPFRYVSQSPHYESGKWPHCSSSSASSQGSLLDRLQSIREEHIHYITKLAQHSNEQSTARHDKVKSDAENRDLYELALRGLNNLSKWTLHIIEVCSWRLNHPTDTHQNKACPPEAEDYEKATKYNYSSAEKFALVEVIAMIKGLQVLMHGMEATFMEAIKRTIFTELQTLVQVKLRDVLRKSVKKQKQLVTIIITSVRDTCADWLRGQEPADDPALKGKKDPSQGYNIKVPRRRVGPSSTQLYMVRTMLESLIDKNAVKGTLKNTLDTGSFTAIDNFHKLSFFWPYLLNFDKTLEKCCDLSQLWFREYYLEMTMGKRIQFPIGMSLPWIPIEHILNTKNASMMESILYPFDLYNDSASYALKVFKSQFLYDEVEAEVNLCFAQFVYKLSDQIFTHFKHVAGSILLERNMREECKKVEKSHLKLNKYDTLLKQRHIQLLGRMLDLNHLISQRVITSLQKSIDVAISRFESGSLMGIIELEGLIECNRLTHSLLCKHLELNDFDAMLKEANHSVSAPYGRITLHVFWELNFDFIVNFCYDMATNRFIKTDVPLTKELEHDDPPQVGSQYVWGSKEMNRAFKNIYSVYQKFFGSPHMRSLCHLLGYQDIALLLEQLIQVVKSLTAGTLQPYIQTLQKVMPKGAQFKTPRFDYGSDGALEFYLHHLKDVMMYPELKTEVFQVFNEIGNIILFCLLVEQTLSLEESNDLKQAAPFQKNIPTPHMPSKSSDDQVEKEKRLAARMEKLEKEYAALNIVPIISKNGTPKQAETVVQGDLLTRERLCCGLSMFEVILSRIKTFLVGPLWQGNEPANGVMNIDDTSEFHRLWSALQFVYCLPVSNTEYTIEQMFGEGLQVAGCTLITLLGQQRRFEAFDFTYHILKAHRLDQKDDRRIRGIDLKKMVDRIRRFQILNQQIFTVLNKYLKVGEVDTPIEHVRCFLPPTYSADQSTV